MIQRHRTAISRKVLSRPMRCLLALDNITPRSSVLDYGCGRGDDIRILCDTYGFKLVQGYDRYFTKDVNEQDLTPVDFVTLSFVLNVIETREERDVILKRAFELANIALIVSVREDTGPENTTPYNDGVLTKANTFQKFYTEQEFRDYCVEVLGDIRIEKLAKNILMIRCDNEK